MHANPDSMGALVAVTGVCFFICFFRLGWPAAPTALPGALQDRIDPNRVGWADLALLPGIGEVKATAIVAFRERQRQSQGHGAIRAFTTPADLRVVRGIGPKTVQRIAPYLRFE
ncbi:MAG: ComEA family DNA-binding protein [Phycisphaerae bacterium]